MRCDLFAAILLEKFMDQDMSKHLNQLVRILTGKKKEIEG
jgi:hypothetical protein